MSKLEGKSRLDDDIETESIQSSQEALSGAFGRQPVEVAATERPGHNHKRAEKHQTKTGLGSPTAPYSLSLSTKTLFIPRCAPRRWVDHNLNFPSPQQLPHFLLEVHVTLLTGDVRL